MRSILLAIACALFVGNTASADEPIVADIVIYGGTSSAVTAAVQAHRMGRSVVVVCPEAHLNQQHRPPEDDRWITIGALSVNQRITIEVETADSIGYVTVDAVQIIAAERP